MAEAMKFNMGNSLSSQKTALHSPCKPPRKHKKMEGFCNPPVLLYQSGFLQVAGDHNRKYVNAKQIDQIKSL